MSNTELLGAVEGLGSTVGGLADAVDRQARSHEAVAQQVRESNERSSRDRRLLWVVLAVGGLALLSNVTQWFAWQETRHAVQLIEDATTPQGKAKQRSDAVLSLALDSLATRGELKRIDTELPISRVKGDTVRVEELEKAKASKERDLASTEAQIRKVQRGEVTPSPTTTTSP